jgi:hypothetical protein
MANPGAQERKRTRRAVPPTIERAAPVGCLIALGIYLGLCLALFALTGSFATMAFGLPAIVIAGSLVVRFMYGLGLLFAVRLRWSARGVRCLIVYSDSPAWEAHIRTTWLPRFGHLAVALNWSERASWRPTLAARLFRRFCGRKRNFNPAVVVFRGLRQPHVFRFFYAFQEVKAGRREYLHRLESELLKVLGVEDAA